MKLLYRIENGFDRMQELMLKKRDKMGQVRGQLKVTYNSNFEKCMFSFILSIIFGFHELYLCACTIFIKDAAQIHVPVLHFSWRNL